MPTSLTLRLRSAPPAVFTAFAGLAGFITYFSMYAFRKPFTAASFEGIAGWHHALDFKIALVIAQLVGYATSKVHRHPGHRGHEGRLPCPRHPRSDRCGVDRADRARRRAARVQNRRHLRQRSVPGHDLGTGVRLHGGPAHLRGARRHSLREFHRLLRRREIRRRPAHAAAARPSAVDARGDWPAVRAGAAARSVGPVRPATAQPRG